MNEELRNKMADSQGFIAALDQSGGSTPKALRNYGIEEDQYSNDEEMFNLVHEMRTRIITSPVFTSEKVVGTILFERTMDSKIEGQHSGDYLIEKGIVPFIKVDKGLADEENGVQLMKPMPTLDELLEKSVKRNMFGTKMRSNILSYNEEGIQAIVEQQFEVGKQILDHDLMPMLEPEVNIHAEDKDKIESFLKNEILKHLDQLGEQKVMLKLTIPETPNQYKELIDHPNVLRVVALSGGYSIDEANEKLSQNEDLIASFSRALLQDLDVNQTDEAFDQALKNAIDSIYEASIA